MDIKLRLLLQNGKERIIDMACQGPNIENSHSKAEMAFNEIKSLLESKYGIVFDETVINSLGGFKHIREDYIQSGKELKRDLQELFWNRDCWTW